MLIKLIDKSIDIEEICFLHPEFQNEIFIMLNIHGEILFASEGIKNFLGFSGNEMIGNSAYDFTLQDENGEIVEAHGKLITKIGVITIIKFRVTHKSGELFWVESTSKSFVHKHSEDIMLISLLKKLDGF